MMCTEQNPVPCRTKVRLILNLEVEPPIYQGVCHDCHSRYQFSALGDKEVGYHLGPMLSFEHKGEPADPALLLRRDEMQVDSQAGPGNRQPVRQNVTQNVSQQGYRPNGQGQRPQQGGQQPRPFRPQENRPMQQEGFRNRPPQPGNRPQPQPNRPMQERPPRPAEPRPPEVKPMVPPVAAQAPVKPIVSSVVTPPVQTPEPKIEPTKQTKEIKENIENIEVAPTKPVRKPRARAEEAIEVKAQESKVIEPAKKAMVEKISAPVKLEAIEAAPAKRRGRPPKRSEAIEEKKE
jgi:hypothetical protein